LGVGIKIAFKLMKIRMIIYRLFRSIFFLFGLLLITENGQAKDVDEKKKNILWIYVEDLTPFMASHGVPGNPTPNIDRLALEGVSFVKAFTPTPVCSSSRSSLITGVNSIAAGTHNHRSAREGFLPVYLPEGMHTLPEYLRKKGYNTFNIGKDDYNFIYNRADLYNVGEFDYDNPRRKFFGLTGKKISYEEMKENQPFFGQVQLKGGKILPGDKEYSQAITNPRDPADMAVPAYFPDIPEIREFIALQHDCVTATDYQVGEIIEGLRKQGILENTYIFFFADHGNRGLREKQFLYDGGLHVPFVVGYFGGDPLFEKGQVRREMVNTLDITASTLHLAGVPIPDHFESRSLWGDNYEPREYLYASRDRCDWTIDRIRTVRSDQYRYIKNYMTDRPIMQPQYRDVWPLTQKLRKMYEDGEMTAEQSFHWSEKRVEKELYDVRNDPDMVNNLAYDKTYRKIVKKMDRLLVKWTIETEDKGAFPESEDQLRNLMKLWGDRIQGVDYEKLRSGSEN
jgi:N-sulfoglucosamine sulfohydrolase